MKKQAQNGKNPTLQRLSSEIFQCYPRAFIIRILSTSWQSVLPSSAFWFQYHNSGVQTGKGKCSSFWRQPRWNTLSSSSAHTFAALLNSFPYFFLKENPCKDGLIGLTVLDRYFPMKGEESCRSVPPGRHEFRFGSCPGELKLPSPTSRVSAPDGILTDTVGSRVLSYACCSWVWNTWVQDRMGRRKN